MNKTTAKTQYKLSTRKGDVILQAGQAQAHKAVPGESYRILKRREGDAGDELAGDVVAQRSGADLQLDYADGTRLTLQDYFTECKPGTDCAVTLAGDTPQGWQLTASSKDGAGLADGSTVLYAHGSPEALAGMVPTHPGLEQPLAGLKGDLVTYVPQDSASVGWLAGVGAGSAGLLAAGGGGGSAAVATASVHNLVTLSFVGGPALKDNDLSVNIYQADGKTLLGTGKLGDDGTVTVDVKDYQGAVIVKLVNGGSASDYLDESTGIGKDLDTSLYSMGVITTPNSTLSLNVNVLTTIAYTKAQEAAGGTPENPSPLTVVQVSQAASAISKVFGVDDVLHTPVIPTNGGQYNPGDGLSAGETYGSLLSAFSGADKNGTGKVQDTLDKVLAGITTSGGTAVISKEAQDLLIEGSKVGQIPGAGQDNPTGGVGGIVDTFAPVFSSGASATATAINENSGAGQVVYQAVAMDSNSVHYSLAAGGDAAAFSINAQTGKVTLTGNPDYETKASYQFTVVATDAAGNHSQQTVTLGINDLEEIPPTVSAVSIAAKGVQNNTLNAGDIVNVTMAMSEDTLVDTTNGVPRIALNLGGSTVYAGYVSGGGTASLVFQYVVQAGDVDADGIAIPADALQLNGGVLKDAAGNHALLSHPALENESAYRVDTDAPAAPALSLVSNTGRADGVTSTAALSTSGTESGALVEYRIKLESGDFADWSANYVAPTVDGRYTVEVRQFDAAGNVSESGRLEFTLDTTAPAAPALQLLASSDSGRFDNDGITSASTPTLRVSLLGSGATAAVAGDVVKVFLGGSNQVGTATLTADDILAGYVDISTSSLGGDGTKSLTATLTDGAGHTGAASAALNLTLDSVAKQLIDEGQLNQQTGVDNPFAGVSAGLWAFPALGDLNGDGRLDLVVGMIGRPNFVRAYYQQEDGSFVQAIGGNYPMSGNESGANYSFPALLDVNGDGLQDMLVGVSNGYGAYEGTVKYFKNTGTTSQPQFTEQTGSNNPFASIHRPGYAFLAAGDIDGDGDEDLLVGQGANSGEAIQLWRNEGNGVFTQVSGVANPFNSLEGVSGNNGFSIPYLGDFNGDGKLDFAVFGKDSKIWLYQGNGHGEFVPEVGNNPFNGLINNIPFAAAGDVDGDGDADFLIGDQGGSISYFRNDVTFALRLADEQISTGKGSNSVSTYASHDLQLSGSGAEAHALITIALQGSNTPIGQATADANGKWSFTWTESLEPGEYLLSVSQTDVAGNTSIASAPYSVVVQPIPTPQVALSQDTGADGSDGISSSAGLSVAGQLSGFVVEYRLKEGSGAFGDWSTSYAAPVVDGTYAVEVRQRDAAGNTSGKASLAFTLDAHNPVFSSETVATAIDENSGAGQVVYSAAANDDHTVVFSLKACGDAGAFSIDSATGQVTLTGNPDYETKAGYSFTVVATDLAGNHSQQLVTLAINNVDDTAPTLAEASPADGAGNVDAGANIVLTFSEAVLAGTGSIRIVNDDNSNQSLSIDVTDSNQVSINGATVTINPSSDLFAGARYHIEVDSGALKDAAGNGYVGISDSTTLNFAVTAGEPLSRTLMVYSDGVYVDQDANGVFSQGDTALVTKGAMGWEYTEAAKGTPGFHGVTGSAVINGLQDGSGHAINLDHDIWTVKFMSAVAPTLDLNGLGANDFLQVVMDDRTVYGNTAMGLDMGELNQNYGPWWTQTAAGNDFREVGHYSPSGLDARLRVSANVEGLNAWYSKPGASNTLDLAINVGASFNFEEHLTFFVPIMPT
ncbi:MAG: Ig-like domain-containing protein [Comamonas sp.]